MEHRRFLAAPEAHRPFAGSGLLERAGGRAAVEALVDRLYDGIAADPALRSLFSRDLANERAAQKLFFVEWLGGEAGYSDHAHLPLKHRHDLLPIDAAMAERWLGHFRHALDVAVHDHEAREVLIKAVKRLAAALVNEQGHPSALRARPHGSCLRYPPAVESLAAARRGDVAALRRLVEVAPDMLDSAPHGAQLLHLAVVAGREDAAEWLLKAGVDPDKPAPVEPMIFATPLCAARWKKRRRIEALLLDRGAKTDVFTHAFLGEAEPLAEAIARGLAQAIDPAVDALQISPIHHAVAGGRAAALRNLLDGLAHDEALVAGARALRMTVAREHVAMAAMLLDRCADATAIGAGRWVLHPELAPMLARAGGGVDRSGAWIGLSCTGNQGRRDDPGYVAALLSHGARVDDRRLTGQGSDGGHATALHYAAKAGFVRTIRLLLDRGADPAARDDNGFTPLDWLDRAGPSVDRAGVRALLRLTPKSK